MDHLYLSDHKFTLSKHCIGIPWIFKTRIHKSSDQISFNQNAQGISFFMKGRKINFHDRLPSFYDGDAAPVQAASVEEVQLGNNSIVTSPHHHQQKRKRKFSLSTFLFINIQTVAMEFVFFSPFTACCTQCCCWFGVNQRFKRKQHERLWQHCQNKRL